MSYLHFTDEQLRHREIKYLVQGHAATGDKLGFKPRQSGADPPSVASSLSHLFIRSPTGTYHMLSPPRYRLRAADVAATKSAEQADGGVAGSDVTVSCTCFEKYGQLHKFRDAWILITSFLFRV